MCGRVCRMRLGGMPCPEPVALKAHIIVMEFIGQDGEGRRGERDTDDPAAWPPIGRGTDGGLLMAGWPAPRLKDADFGEKRAKALYHECILLMRRLFQTCKLVHGDLSEYNML